MLWFGPSVLSITLAGPSGRDVKPVGRCSAGTLLGSSGQDVKLAGCSAQDVTLLRIPGRVASFGPSDLQFSSIGRASLRSASITVFDRGSNKFDPSPLGPVVSRRAAHRRWAFRLRRRPLTSFGTSSSGSTTTRDLRSLPTTGPTTT